MEDSRPLSKACSAVILAGGLNTRMGGRNKAFLTIAGKNILHRQLSILSPLFDDIVLVTRKPELYQNYPVRIVKDIFTCRSSLTGIHAGLHHAHHPFAFVVPCDAPFLQEALVQSIIHHIEPQFDVIVPVSGSNFQPLCAVYSKRCLGPIEAQLKRGDYKIIDFFDKVALKTIEESRLKDFDPDLRSFLNVNTPDDYEDSKKKELAAPAGSKDGD